MTKVETAKPAPKPMKTQETVEKTFKAGRIEELADVQRANLEAAFAAGTKAMKNVETLSAEMLAFNKKAMEEGVANAKKLFECKTVQEVVELQTDLACAQLEAMLEQGTKMTDLALRMAGEVAEPAQARFGETVEKLGKPLAA